MLAKFHLKELKNTFLLDTAFDNIKIALLCWHFFQIRAYTNETSRVQEVDNIDLAITPIKIIRLRLVCRVGIMCGLEMNLASFGALQVGSPQS